jgi:hypothetical protein
MTASFAQLAKHLLEPEPDPIRRWAMSRHAALAKNEAERGRIVDKGATGHAKAFTANAQERERIVAQSNREWTACAAAEVASVSAYEVTTRLAKLMNEGLLDASTYLYACNAWRAATQEPAAPKAPKTSGFVCMTCLRKCPQGSCRHCADGKVEMREYGWIERERSRRSRDAAEQKVHAANAAREREEQQQLRAWEATQHIALNAAELRWQEELREDWAVRAPRKQRRTS